MELLEPDDMEDRQNKYLHIQLKERIKQLRMEWLFEEPCTYEDEEMSDWRAKLLELDPDLPELHKRILIDGPQTKASLGFLVGYTNVTRT